MALVTSFEAYVAEHSVALQRFAYLVVRNAEDARDLVQEALIGLYPHWQRVAARGSVDAYVRRSIVNASINRWRKVGAVTPVAEPERLGAEPSADPAQAIADADEAWRLCAALPRHNAPRWSCASTRTGRSPRSPTCSAVPRRPPGPTSTAPCSHCAPD